MGAEAPRCVVIAGPNGAGKTTFAREFLVRELGIFHFVNADLIAAGISPLKPELARVAAGRLFLRQIDDLAARRLDFCFETTMSGSSHAERLRRWQREGYRIAMLFLSLDSESTALQRVAFRVAQGGHDVPAADVIRRYHRGWENFLSVYRPLANEWAIYDNSLGTPVLKERWP